ncbi:MAG: hypothetical protein JWN66_1263 [Sphingomonas bacterium]|uniref:hypothetical protein n=1 Tax=Sphingomonas bacterium TaxID=1895847 RepID=UPI0026197EB1|nr:hypothetical protein [Sphingomonas bacterium]MDB5704147.1 hypothetical protein [Sphingomonas bacterium]
MRQTTLSVALEVKPASQDSLSALIDALHDNGAAPARGSRDFGWFMQGVPSVHFLSLSVFPGEDYDPLFVLEANFDGPPGVFWGQLEAAIGGDLRAMIRCCKRPLNQDAPLYDAVTAAESRAPVAPYMEARSIEPSVFHHGNRGMTRDRVLAESSLFGAIRTEIATANGPGPSPYRGAVTPADIHARLRTALLPAFPWLGEKAPARIGALERVVDITRLLAFVFVVVVALSLPGLILAPIMPTGRYFILMAFLLLLVAVPLYRIREPLPGTGVADQTSVFGVVLKNLPLIALFVGIYFAVVAPLATLVASLLTGNALVVAWAAAARTILLGLASIPFTAVGILAWLRWLERRDSSQDAPPIDEEVVRQMAQREDWIPQNHMGSVVLIKPGVLRTIIVRAGHHGLGLFLRVKATDGYLGSMRTVHFAHWAFVNNGSRLMFFSNFDQSWESYLDDFIEKAHAGLTLAWGCGVGFPATRFLIQDGASHGRKFKAWARHSMAVSRFWYSAYSNLTVDQVERNNRIANGLRRKSLTSKEAAAWINDL